MKKLIAVMLMLILALTLASCGKKEEKTAETDISIGLPDEKKESSEVLSEEGLDSSQGISPI